MLSRNWLSLGFPKHLHLDLERPWWGGDKRVQDMKLDILGLILALPSPSCVTLDRSLNLSEPHGLMMIRWDKV